MKRKFLTYSDNELIKLFKNNSNEAEQAFAEIYHRYSSQVHAYCCRVLNNQDNAEDIFQETFIKFYQNVQINYESSNIPGFLIKIARNLCLNFVRDNKKTVPLDEQMDFIYESNQSYEKTELQELLTMALDLLDFEYREAFVLREYDGLPYEEIANVCNISLANAKSRVHRAKLKIKEILTPYLKDYSK